MYLANDRTRQRHPLHRRFSHLLMLEGGAFGTDCRASKIGNPGACPSSTATLHQRYPIPGYASKQYAGRCPLGNTM
jgi:hypothetical protein